MPNGKLLVLDGLDGSGKSTQFELLQTALQKQGVSIQAVSFPDYDSPSAALVKMYLNGELSNTPDGVNAYAASSFYAVDRYANYHLHWEQAYHLYFSEPLYHFQRHLSDGQAAKERMGQLFAVAGRI